MSTLSPGPRMYGAYPTDLYHAVHTGNPGDVEWYGAACRGAHRVLDLGCGTGRLTAGLAAAGAAVTGVDRDGDALAVAAAAGLRCVAGDLREFDLGARFERVVLGYNTLYCLLDDDAVLACLQRVAAHLDPGGRLLLDAYAMEGWHREGAPPAPESAPAESLGRVVAGGREYEVSEETRWWPQRQRVDAHYRYRPLDGGPVVEATIAQRYLLAEQLERLLARAGLAAQSLHGDFAGSRYRPDSEHMVVVAVAAARA